MLSRFGAYGGTMPRPKTLSKKVVKGIAPGINEDALVGAVKFYDAQIDDARHTVAVARTAAAHGAAIATRATVLGLLREDGRVVGALIRDELTGREFECRARVVIGAAGVWTDQLLEMAGAQTGGAVRQSKGIHLVVRREVFPSTSALIARTPTSVLFLIPWGQYWLIGTTDTDYDGNREEPQIDQADVDYLLGEANKWLATAITVDDVIGIYSGLRPLLQSGGEEDGTSTLSREHAVLRPAPGLVLIAGGKYTTYRVMAQDAVDAAVVARSEVFADPVPESTTDRLPLVGAGGYAAAWASRERTARESSLPLATVEHLLRRHGDRVTTVLDLVANDPSLAEPMHPQAPYLMAEAVLAVTREGAMGLDDVLVRRTRLALETRDGGVDVARSVAEVIAPYANWTQDEVDAQVLAVVGRRDALQPVPGGEASQQAVVNTVDLQTPAQEVEQSLQEADDSDLGVSMEGRETIG